MPLQVSPSGKDAAPIARPIAVAVFVDCSAILGLPKLRLRDANGKVYQPNKTLLQEPLAQIHDHAGVSTWPQTNARRAYIHSYVRR